MAMVNSVWRSSSLNSSLAPSAKTLLNLYAGGFRGSFPFPLAGELPVPPKRLPFLMELCRGVPPCFPSGSSPRSASGSFRFPEAFPFASFRSAFRCFRACFLFSFLSFFCFFFCGDSSAFLPPFPASPDPSPPHSSHSTSSLSDSSLPLLFLPFCLSRSLR